MIQFTEAARADLTEIAAWIATNNPIAAEQVLNTILAGIEPLAEFQMMGRIGRVSGTRELVISSLPYVIVYKPLLAYVAVIRVLHGAMQWPQEAIVPE